MTAAREALVPFGNDAPLLIAVTVLTSMDESDLRDLGVTLSPAEHAERLARLAQNYRLAIVHGNGPQVGLLSLQNLAYGDVEPYPLDVLVAESQGMIGYMLAQSLSAQPQMPPDRKSVV